MKLLAIFAANQSWGKLTQLKMSPRMAYGILKYAKLLAAEYEIVEKARVGLIHELTHTGENEQASLEPGTPEHQEYVKRFSAILDVDSELKPSDLKFDDMLAQISDDQANVLSPQELGVLEPFFAT